MTAREQGFLLLTGQLGDPQRKPLTVAQFRELTRRARLMEKPVQEREMTVKDLLSIGCDRSFAHRILTLLSHKEQLQWYLKRGQQRDCYPITRLSDIYPQRVRQCLGMEAPGSLWAKGDADLLQTPKLALVGSRDLHAENRSFARELGKQAALQGYTLVSGNARGADKAAQESCLSYGGSVISVVADALKKYPVRQDVLYLAEDGYDLEFSAQRALSRNRIIHALAQKTFVAQCSLNKGGTWDGTVKNLRFGWSAVFCFHDSSDACLELTQMGAVPVSEEDLIQIAALQSNSLNYIDQ